MIEFMAIIGGIEILKVVIRFSSEMQVMEANSPI